MPFPTPAAPRSPISSTERTVVHFLVHHYRSQGMSASVIKRNLLEIDGWSSTEGEIRNMWKKEREEIEDRRGKGGGRPPRSPETKKILIDSPECSISTIQRMVSEKRDKPISRSTVSYELNGMVWNLFGMDLWERWNPFTTRTVWFSIGSKTNP